MEQFIERRDSILSHFKQAKEDLEALNKDIDAEIDANQYQMANLAARNEDLRTLKSSNELSVKAFGRFFK
jgi:flagellar hook-associated protein FlgK